ncbi:MAG: folylpolyglutamate synthase/dihydrofolate synthase family protein [Clostridiaceae bacterium]
MNYKECMSYIHGLNKFGMNFGLSRTERILELLGDPHKRIKFIHVAGTNGKGSTTAIISSILKTAGYKTGMFTSPFLEEFEERIQINGNNIPKEHLIRYTEMVREVIDQVAAEGMGHPTEFEVITCIMFKYFSDMEVDFGVVEVGLGGTLDSTNVLTPVLSVITSISYDHMNVLGNTIQEIAAEKAGIIKEGIPAVIYPQEKETLKVIQEKAEMCKSQLYYIDIDNSSFLQVINKDSRILQRVRYILKDEEIILDLPLLGKHQITNCLTALTAVKALEVQCGIEIDDNSIKKGIESVIWKGRMEVMRYNPLVVIDGAHNIDGIKKLKENLKTYFSYNNLILILGILADKQVDEMIKEICPEAKEVIAVTPNSERAELSEVLRDKILENNLNAISKNSYEDAYRYALSRLGEGDMLLISGSLYMIGDMRKIINNNDSTR